MLKQSLLALTIITISGCGGSSGGPAGAGSAANKVSETSSENDDIASAQSIPVNTQVTGRLNSVDDITDYYSINVPSPKTITVELRATNVDFDLTLYDENTVSISYSSSLSGNESLTRHFSAGTYYLSVTAYQGSGQYTLLVN